MGRIFCRANKKFNRGTQQVRPLWVAPMATIAFSMNPSSSHTPAGSPDGPALYHALTAFFQTTLPARLELEILPSSFPLPPSIPASLPLLIDGPALAIRRADLVRAFLHAGALFSASAGASAAADVQDARLAATYVVLLQQPEHLTAANYRKRAILRLRRLARDGGSTDGKGGGAEVLRDALRRELAFIASLLTSPLDKHPRSPTLWSHRAWVLRTFRAELAGGGADRGQSGSGAAVNDGQAGASGRGWRVTLGSELGVVLGAAERHAANYYAWMHARRAMDILLADDSADPQEGDVGRPEPEAEGLRDAVETVRGWCLAHPRDISGWTFLACALRRMRDEALQQEVRESVERFVQDVGWEGESVKCFLGMVTERQVTSTQGPREPEMEHD